MILPDATLGVLGGGQLGRMFTLAAHAMGYRVCVLDPDPDSPAGLIADRHLQAAYTDVNALDHLARDCAAVTTEFENVPPETLEQLEQRLPVRPGSRAVAIARNRIAEKNFLREQGLATAAFRAIESKDELAAACSELRLPALLKTAQLGYDGKGQFAVTGPEEAQRGFELLGNTSCIIEERVQLDTELSVILARDSDGHMATYPVGENTHVNGILDTTCVPGRVTERIAKQARQMTESLAEALDYCGVLAVEFFLTRDEELLINEIAPRPHNSGHYSIDACLTSQFEQQVRMLCGLPPGSTQLLSPVVMLNLLGDLWQDGASPAWHTLYQHPQAKLHLYGKKQPRSGRKMGHCNCLSGSVAEAAAMAERIRAGLQGG